MKKRKPRHVTVSRAASLKGARTRKRMKEAREFVVMFEEDYLTNYEAATRRSLHQVTGRTIDLVPKVEWEK